MQTHPDLPYDLDDESQARTLRHVELEHGTTFVAPRPWRDPAVWCAIVGPIIGLGYLAYFVRVILTTVAG
ncbi:MAG: hypothetical protein JO023_06075 [Chloroflexi bacterium]|nr:hypothetical protein [Chloroflexota bacterium]